VRKKWTRDGSSLHDTGTFQLHKRVQSTTAEYSYDASATVERDGGKLKSPVAIELKEFWVGACAASGGYSITQ
jgi:hypothetical protein